LIGANPQSFDGPPAGLTVALRHVGSRKTGVPRIALPFTLTTLAVFAGTPRARAVAADIHDIDDAVIRASIPAVPISSSVPIIPAIFPPWTPFADIDAAAIPIAIVVEPRADGESDSKCQRRTIIRLISALIDHLGIVLWHVDEIWLSGHDSNARFFADDALLRCVDEIAGSRCRCPKALD
jgi:hypothetical protein